MIPEKQRVAIAKACGWTRLREAKLTGGLVGMPPNGEIDDFCTAPDYCNDLNAMHEAEKTLTLEESRLYRIRLKEVCCKHQPASDWRCPVFADAAQKADAFLWVISKREEA